MPWGIHSARLQLWDISGNKQAKHASSPPHSLLFSIYLFFLLPALYTGTLLWIAVQTLVTGTEMEQSDNMRLVYWRDTSLAVFFCNATSTKTEMVKIATWRAQFKEILPTIPALLVITKVCLKS
jgi:hypothetical protein